MTKLAIKEQPITVSVKPNCLTISIEGTTQTDVFSYDYEGRLWTALLDGVAYRRGLHGTMVAKWQVPGNSRERRRLLPDEALEIEERARQTAADLFAALQSKEAGLTSPLSRQDNEKFHVKGDRKRCNLHNE